MNNWTDSSFNKIQTLATLAALLIGAVMYVSEIEKDVAILEANQVAMKAQIAEYQADNKAMFNRIDAKLDKMIDIIHDYRKE
jgi:hypothetical protein|tara:strand:+ start:829 stop:1074 length:246 start_codon:yes stop_codon:yes gene_type:complete